MKTYMQFVNDAIRESKVSLDPLTSGTFASPPRTAMYNNFKEWVNRAYKELLLKRKEWQFRVERGTASIYPRLHLSGLSALPVVGETWYGVSSGVQFDIVEVFTSVEDVEDDATIEATVSVEIPDGYFYENLILTEDVTDGVKTGYFKAQGRYSFKPLVTNLEDIDIATMSLSYLPQAVVDGTATTQTRKLIVVPYEKWALEYEYAAFAAGVPEFITETPQGTYDFYPKPDGQYIVSFDFTRKLDQMVAYNDMPTEIPEQYEDWILWAAVLEYADYDANIKVGARAKKKLEYYDYLMERDFLEVPRFEGSRFYTY